MEVRAVASDQPVSPRKVRLVLAKIEGMPVAEALALLEFLPAPSARMVHKVVRSAAANAEKQLRPQSGRAGDQASDGRRWAHAEAFQGAFARSCCTTAEALRAH